MRLDPVRARVPTLRSRPDMPPSGTMDRPKGTSKNGAVGVKLDVSRGLPDRGQA